MVLEKATQLKIKLKCFDNYTRKVSLIVGILRLKSISIGF